MLEILTKRNTYIKNTIKGINNGIYFWRNSVWQELK